jgi:hypothetical protein
MQNDWAYEMFLKYKLQLISFLIINRPISPQEASLTWLQTPIVQKSVVVRYIDSKPLHRCTKKSQDQKIWDFIP